MIKVALTGNMGSGKSTVAKIFSTLDIPVFHADYEAKLLYKREDVKQQVRRQIGDTVFDDTNEICFKSLAKLVFNHPEYLKSINHIIHPLVFESYKNWLLLNKNHKYTIHEAAIIFENKLERHFDLIINVSAPGDVRLKRIIERDGLTAEQFYARTKNQMTDEAKNRLSDFVILNDGRQFLIPQVMEIHEHIVNL